LLGEDLTIYAKFNREYIHVNIKTDEKIQNNLFN